MRFPWPTKVVDANNISIASAVFAGLTRPTDRPTDHATRSVTIGGAHSGEAKFCYCLRLQQVFIGAVDSTDRINFSNQQLYSAVRLDDCIVLNEHSTVFASNRSAIYNRCFPGPTRFLNANYLDRFRIFLLGSLCDRPTDRRTDHATRSFTIGGSYLCIKGKERKSIYIAPLVCYVYLKALRHGSQCFTGKYTVPTFPS